jgi:hypothetical protein
MVRAEAMPSSYNSSLFRVGFVLALLIELAGCTPGGQFDPTEMFNSDMFDTKKKLQGQREAVFPNGVPGTTTGVPADLVKGYQPPPDQADANPIPPAPASVADAAKPKPKPKPKVASAPPRNPNAVWNQKPAAAEPTRISVGSKPASGTAQQQTPSSQTAWPAPTAPAQSSQSVWPAPAPTAPAQQTAQPSQSVWPNPPAPGTSTQ